MPTITSLSKYAWKTIQHPVPADEVFAEFQQLAAENQGVVRPVDFVERARPEESLLHPLFEWNDAEAAERFRLVQARMIMSNIVEIRVKEDSSRVGLRSVDYVRVTANVHTGQGQGYIEVNVIDDREAEKQLYLDSLREAYRFIKKFEQLPRAQLLVTALQHYLSINGDDLKEIGINPDAAPV